MGDETPWYANSSQSFAENSSPDNHVPEDKGLLLTREGDSGRRVTWLYSHINFTLEDLKLMRGEREVVEELVYC